MLLNFGTAVMGPEVYLKALAMARNVAHQEGRRINRFTTAVFDLADLGGDVHHEAPKTDRALLLPPVQDDPGAHRARTAARASTFRATTGARVLNLYHRGDLRMRHGPRPS